MKSLKNLCFEDFPYYSSFDGTGPLRALVAYRADGRPKPLLVCMHSYGGDRRQMVPCLTKKAGKGFFAMAPDMRGRADSAGQRDDGGLEIADIADAVSHVLRNYGNEIDAANINIVGWSGGGGSVYMATVKMPELFRSAQAFYGISDYGYLARSSEDWMKQVSQRVGQTPDQAPQRYLARNAIHAIGNNRCAHFQIFWDEEETLCPKEMNTTYLQEADKLGLSNVIGRPSAPGDQGRWFHGKEVHEEIADAMYEPQILSGKFSETRLASNGKLLVAGFLITRRFALCLGTGEDIVATVNYQWDDRVERLEIHDAQAPEGTRGWARFPLDARGLPKRLLVNDQVVAGVIQRVENREHFYLYNLGMNDRIQLEWSGKNKKTHRKNKK